MIFKGTQMCSLYQKEGYSYNGNSDCEEKSSLSFISVQLIDSFTLLRSWVKRNKRIWLYKQKKKPAHEAQQGLSLSQVFKDNCTIFHAKFISSILFRTDWSVKSTRQVNNKIRHTREKRMSVSHA
jgi:hypothetical protein